LTGGIVTRIAALLLAVAAAGTVLVRAQQSDLLAAIRLADPGEIRRIVAAGANPNVRDESGATALMHAAIYASAADMSYLIDKGADVNTANGFGSTALMWAAGETAKVKLLLEHGANFEARAVDRTTPLIAATRWSNVEAMRLLLARRNQPVTASDHANLLRIAYTQGSADVRRVLAEHGIALTDAARFETPLLSPNVGDAPVLRTLLDAGLDANQQTQIVTLRLPALAFAAVGGQLDAVRLLTSKGAAAGAAGTHGWTPLMMAAASVDPDPALVDLLLAKGAEINARDDAGRTALDWAMLQGETPVVHLLRKSGGTSMAPPFSAPPVVATPRPAASAIEKALAQLQPASPVFFERTKCISCHHQSLPAIAVKRAADRGLRVDRVLAAHPTDSTLSSFKGLKESLMLANPGIGGFVVASSYALASMDEEHRPPTPETDAVVLLLASLQRQDGSWNIPVGAAGGGLRPPLGAGRGFNITAFAVRSLLAYTPPGRRGEAEARIARARHFFRTATPRDTQDEAFKLIGLIWSQASRTEIADQTERLTALQRPDGGWAQLPTMTSDAYATGEALYALSTSGMPASAVTYQQGVAYLLRTQLEDGTWLVRSRGFGFQPYFETGFPHGRDQFISAAATAYAAIALTHGL
jgi:ankyrin repeat protein